MPGPYLEYDPVKEEKRIKHKKKQLLQRKKDIKYKMMKIEEMTEGDDESQGKEIAEDDIWDLDDEDSDDGGIQGIDEGGSESNSSNSSDEADEN